MAAAAAQERLWVQRADARAPPGDDEGHVRLWDTRTRAKVAAFRVHEDFVADMHHAEARRALLTASGDGTLAVLDLRASKVTGRSDNQEDELLSGAFRLGARSVWRMLARLRPWPTMITRVCDAAARRAGHNTLCLNF